jgi:hypothetical protein
MSFRVDGLGRSEAGDQYATEVEELYLSSTILIDFLTKATEFQATTLDVGFWHIWETRNEAHKTDARSNPQRTCGKILAYVD